LVIYKQFNDNLKVRIELTRERLRNSDYLQNEVKRALRDCAASIAVNYEDEQLIAIGLLKELMGNKNE
jgi:hypothetical protein